MLDCIKLYRCYSIHMHVWSLNEGDKKTDERPQDRPQEKQAVMLLLLKLTAILALKYIFKVQTSAVTQWKASRISLEWAQLWNNSHDKHLSPQTCKEKQQPSVLIKGPYQNLFTFQSICFKHAGCSSSKLTNCYNSPLLILFKHFHTGTNSKNC